MVSPLNQDVGMATVIFLGCRDHWNVNNGKGSSFLVFF